MGIEFDRVKDEINLRKHGISLAAAEDMEYGSIWLIPDCRRDYGEERFWAVGKIEGRLHILTFTMRGEAVRAISLRKTNRRERARYEQESGL